jgi:hypothetical protein
MSCPRPARDGNLLRGLKHERFDAAIDGTSDLWVIAAEIDWIDLPPSFARLRHSPPRSLTQGYPEAMSADIVLTSHVRSPPAKPGERASELTCGFASEPVTGVEPATSSLQDRSGPPDDGQDTLF